MYLQHLLLDLNFFETLEPTPAPIAWSFISPDEDAETKIERVYHFQAHSHALLGAWLTGAYLDVASASFKTPPNSQTELAWESISRLLTSFSRSVLIPTAEFELSLNASIASAHSAKRLVATIGSNLGLLDTVRSRVLLNTYYYAYCMLLLYRNHPTFSDKLASQKLEKIGLQIKRLIESNVHTRKTFELLEQAMTLANAEFRSLS